MHSSFLNHIKGHTDIPEEQEKQFFSLVKVKKIQAGECFVKAGEFSRSVGFVVEGLFRYFYSNEKGGEFTKGFFEESSVLVSYSAILKKRPSYFSIQALEPSVIEVVNFSSFNNLLTGHPCWFSFYFALLQKGYLIKEEREREFLLMDAEERYRAFLNRFPNLEKRIKQNLVASYLGITPESLSRIRRKLN